MTPPDPTPDPPPAPSRSDLALWVQALRNDWPIPAAVKKQLLQSAINIADPPEDGDPKAKAPSKRLRLSAMKVIAAFSRLSLDQQRLDLARERAAKPDAESATDGDGVPAERAEAALKALNEPDLEPTRGRPDGAADQE